MPHQAIRPLMLLPIGLLLSSCSAPSRRVAAPVRSPAPPSVKKSAPPALPASRPSGPRFWSFETPAGALAEILKSRPRVIGIGEYHQKTGSAKVQSPLRRFTNQMLEYLSDQTSDLIVELLLPESDCGGKSDKVAKKVEKTTDRPQATENEAVALLLRARRLGVRPHVLTLSCKDYKELLGSDEVDYDRLLTIITEKIVAKTKEALARRVHFDAMGQLRNQILIYGGALHNDIFPAPDLKAYSYAAVLQKLTRGRYIELDLYVPEYIDGDAELAKQSWYSIFRRESKPREGERGVTGSGKSRVVLIERGPASYILILQRQLLP